MLCCVKISIRKTYGCLYLNFNPVSGYDSEKRSFHAFIVFSIYMYLYRNEREINETTIMKCAVDLSEVPLAIKILMKDLIIVE